MNFAEIEHVWRSSHNRPTAAQLEEIKMKFIADLRRRHRGNRLFLALIFSLLLFLTGKVCFHVLWPGEATARIEWAREWAIIPFLALPWFGWLFMLHLHRQHRSRHPNCESSIQASVAALLDENRAERTRYKFIAGLLVASVLILPLIIHQLRAVGKVGDEVLIPAYVIYPTYVLGVLIWTYFYHRRRLLPRKQELETLLKSYV